VSSILDFVLDLGASATLWLAGEIRKPFPRRSAQLCDLVAQLLSKVDSPRAQQLRANALVREGMAWASVGDLEKSLALNDLVINRYRQSLDSDVLVSVAWAMVNKGHDLSELDRRDEAITVYRDLAESMPTEEPFLDSISQGLMNWAIDLDSMNRHGEEKELYDRIQVLLGETSDLNLQSRLAWSLVNKGVILIQKENYAGSIEQFDVVIGRWWAGISLDTPMALHEALAAAGRHRCYALGLLGRDADVVETGERTLERYASSRDRGIEAEVAWAAVFKAFAEGRLGRVDDARRTCEFVQSRYRRSQPQQAAAARRMLERSSAHLRE
jgi:tetratricopeptide (TPR) repeat protein